MIASAQRVYRYRVDQADRIDSVDQWWLAFAAENNAPGLDEQCVVGRVIWDFIADQPTATLYREIHERVRSTGNPILVPFRCDSPTLKRYMQLTIRHQAEGRLLYESTLIRTVPRRVAAILDPRTERSAAFLTMCSFCKRALIEPAGWLEIEDIAIRLRMYDQQAVPELRYTVCPQCASRQATTG